MKNPLYKTIIKIIDEKRHGSVRIKHSDFSHIRNQSSVKAILTELGYTANCQAKPDFWEKKAIDEKQYIDPAKIVIPKNKRKEVSISEQIRIDLLAGELIVLDQIPLGRKYVIKIINDIRKLGVKIDMLKGDQGAATAYRLAGQ